MSDEQLKARKESLLSQLQKKIRHEEFWKNVNNRATLGLLALAILASITAGILGLIEVNTRIVGCVAFIPGALTYFATSFNFQQRATVHREKAMHFKHLKGRFEFEMPDPPSADQIALIHREMTTIEAQIEQQNPIAVSFNKLGGDGKI